MAQNQRAPLRRLRLRLRLRLLPTLLLTAGLAGCSATGRLSGSRPDPLPLPPGITVAFNHRAEARYRSPISGQWRSGDDLEALLLEAIRSARRELLVAVQELSLPAVAEALVERQRAGVRVRVVLENTYSQPWSEQHDAELSPHLRQRKQQLMALADRNHDGVLSADERQRGDAVGILQRAGVPLLDDTADGSAGSGLMHSKFVVVDRRLVVSGSANFTPSCIHGDPDDDRTRGNVNHLLRIESAALAAAFAAEFTRMWGDGPGGRPDSRFGLAKQQGGVQELWVGPTRIRLLFAPHRRSDPNQGLTLLASVLGQARRRVDLALFVFSAQELTAGLAQLQQRGVALRVLADPGLPAGRFPKSSTCSGRPCPIATAAWKRATAPWPGPWRAWARPAWPAATSCTTSWP